MFVKTSTYPFITTSVFFPEFDERLFASSVFVPEFLLDTGVSFFVLKPMSTIGALIALYLVSFTILFD